MDELARIIERSNQRGGRMLSVLDLIQAGTFTLGQAAWLMQEIAAGASWLVGASPGGAGKTTIMGALLGVVPAPRAVYLANPGTGWESAEAGACVVAYEISPGRYDAYIWGAAVKTFASLPRRGVRAVSNLHADTVDEAAAQVVDDSGADAGAFTEFGLFIPIRQQSRLGLRCRVVEEVQQFHDGAWGTVTRADAESRANAGCVAFLQRCLERGTHLITDVRRAWLEDCHAR